MGIAKRNQNLDKNPNLKPRKKPWSGEINFPGHNFIENDPNKILAGELLVYKGQPLSQDYLRTVDEDYREEIAKSVYNFCLNYDWMQFKYADKDIKKALESLKKYEPKVDVEDEIRYVSNSGTSGYQIYRHFFPNLIKVRGVGRPSIYDNLINKEKLWYVILNRIGNHLLYNDDPNGVPVQYPMNISLSQLCIGAKNSGLSSMASIFKPTVAKTIYKHWIKDGDKILDYSCGFGTRLIGLISCGFNNVKYCGYEPNTETYNNLLNMVDYFKLNAEIKKSGSETDDLFDEKFDCAFSSPPYFNVEKYSEEETQCYNKYPEYEGWLEKYWRQTVKNCKYMLKDDGVFGVNIGGEANSLMKKLETDLNQIVVEEGFSLVDTWYMKTSKSHLSAKKGNADKKHKLEGIFFYRK